MNNKIPTLRKKVDFRDPDCLEAAVLVLMGCSTKLIVKRTGLTPCQTTYRITKAGIHRRDYRDGESISFKIVYNAARGKLAGEVAGKLVKKPHA